MVYSYITAPGEFKNSALARKVTVTVHWPSEVTQEYGQNMLK